MNDRTISTSPSNTETPGGLFALSISKREWTVILILTIAALTFRLIALFFFQEHSGDGPSRAMQAYMWSISPVFRPHIVWLPGYIYLTGMFHVVVHDPLVSTRILNLFLGTLTIPVFYLLIRRVFDDVSALVSATLLVVFPFHIKLSVTSLTEISFLLEIILGTLLVLRASVAAGWRRLVGLILSIFVLGLASLTRYESWILLPLFPAYFFIKTSRFYQSLFLAIGLALFPIAWMVASFVEAGSFLPAYGAAMFDAREDTGLFGALKIIVRFWIKYFGWVIPVLTAGGFLLLLADAVKKQLSIERLLYLAVVCLKVMFCVKFGMDRGSSLWVRYLLFIFVMVLPFGIFFMNRYFRNYSYIIILAVLLAAAPSFIFHVLGHDEYVTRKTNPAFETLGRWLADSTFQDSPLLMTEMKWKSTYLPLHRPEIAFRYMIVSDWLDGAHLRDYISTFKPQLLITRDGEQKYISRIENFFADQIIEEDRLIYNQDTLKVYDLRGLSPSVNSLSAPINRCVPVGPDFIKKGC